MGRSYKEMVIRHFLPVYRLSVSSAALSKLPVVRSMMLVSVRTGFAITYPRVSYVVHNDSDPSQQRSIGLFVRDAWTPIDLNTIDVKYRGTLAAGP